MKLLVHRSGLLRATLPGLFLVVLLGAEILDVHDHDADTSGLNNEGCPLTRLAVVGWGLPALARETPPQPAPVIEPASPPAVVHPARPAGSAFAPRRPARDLLSPTAH